MKRSTWLGAFALLAVAAGSANATVPDHYGDKNVFEYMQRNTSGGTTQAGWGVGGVKVTPTPYNASGWQRAGNFGYKTDATGVTLGAAMEVPYGQGAKTFQANMRGHIGRAALYDGFGILLRNAAKFTGPLGLVALAADLASTWPNGTDVKMRPRQSTSAEDLEANPFEIKRVKITGIWKYAGFEDATPEGVVKKNYPHLGAGRIRCEVAWPYANCWVNEPGGSYLGQPYNDGEKSDQWEPASWADARPEWLSMEQLPSDVVEKQVKWARDHEHNNGIGEPYKVAISPSLSGPASLPPTKKEERKTTTRPSTTGTGTDTVTTTTTTTTTTTVSYDGDKIKLTDKETTTTTTKVTDPTGKVTETTDTTDKETDSDTPTKDDAAKEDLSFTDPAMPPVPDLYERKYPDGIVGVWNQKLETIKSSSLFGLVPGLTPNLGDGGCPQWSLSADIGLVDFGTYDVSLPCSVWAFVRIVMLVTSLWLARRIIFGG